MIITIDGPAAAGKGTLAAALADKFGLAYFDTGMVYRAVGLQMLMQNIALDNDKQAQKLAEELTFPLMMKLSSQALFRSLEGSRAASSVAAMQGVRKALLKMQQDFSLSPVFADGSKAKGAIYDGRDTGTVICPHADVKFFITASPEIRAMRRFKEYQDKGQAADYNEVLAQTKARDERDFSREGSKPAKDAIMFDTSDMSIEEVFAKACRIIEEKL
ncbi:MAG: (d)CMP kinase [Alphaproteobacteria bacterium]|nr:(d)CMP kinase [Alphaproteobacteria bacterium]